MHYYQFNIGDYASHTAHLEPLEDLAYRRLIDWYYLNEKPVPLDITEVSKLIRMRTHCGCIESVLSQFFRKGKSGWMHKRIESDLASFLGKSKNAKRAARIRWEREKAKQKQALAEDANAMRTQCERNADAMPTNNHKPITINQEPRTNNTTSTRAPALDYSSWPCMPSEQVMQDWLAMRKRIKAHVSQTVVNNFGKSLHRAVQAGYTVDDCLSECITRNWRGFKVEWMEGDKHAAGKRISRETVSERANRAADEAFGTGTRSAVLEGDFNVIDQDGPVDFAGSGALPSLGGRAV